MTNVMLEKNWGEQGRTLIDEEITTILEEPDLEDRAMLLTELAFRLRYDERDALSKIEGFGGKSRRFGPEHGSTKLLPELAGDSLESLPYNDPRVAAITVFGLGKYKLFEARQGLITSTTRKQEQVMFAGMTSCSLVAGFGEGQLHVAHIYNSRRLSMEVAVAEMRRAGIDPEMLYVIASGGVDTSADNMQLNAARIGDYTALGIPVDNIYQFESRFDMEEHGGTVVYNRYSNSALVTVAEGHVDCRHMDIEKNMETNMKPHYSQLRPGVTFEIPK